LVTFAGARLLSGALRALRRRARSANRTAVLTTVTAQSDPELFFGLRGGAPIFSIVVAMTVRTFPVPQQVR